MPRIGLALGSGAARGWSHFGVIRALQRMGVSIDVIAGTSIGAIVAAAYASGGLDAMQKWVESLTWVDVLSLMDVSLRGGALQGDRVIDYCAEHFFATRFEDLSIPFACVATELTTGREIWLREGELRPAVRASIGLPGMFTPTKLHGRWLVDGGLVNPVPVSLCRALGAEIVIAVELGSGRMGRHFRLPNGNGGVERWKNRLFAMVGVTSSGDADQADSLPPIAAVLTTSVNIMQMRIAQSRLAGDPPEVLISPRVADLSILDFHRGAEAIEEGEAAVQRVQWQITELLESFR